MARRLPRPPYEPYTIPPAEIGLGSSPHVLPGIQVNAMRPDFPNLAARALYDLEVLKRYAPDMLHGAGLPGSLPEAGAMAGTALGAMFGQPDAWDLLSQALGQGVAEPVTHPLRSATQTVDRAIYNPEASVAGLAGAAGLGGALGGLHAYDPSLAAVAQHIRPIDRGKYIFDPEVMNNLSQAYAMAMSHPRLAVWRGNLEIPTGSPQAATEFSRIWSALSANTDVPRNTRESLIAQLRILLQGRQPFTKKEGMTLGLVPGGKIKGINLGLAGQPLEGLKTNAMADYNLGIPGRYPFDRHIGRATLADEFPINVGQEVQFARPTFNFLESLPPETIYPGTGRMRMTLPDEAVYNRFENAMGNSLRAIDPTRDPIDVFGTTWDGIRMLNENEWQPGLFDILTEHGLMQPGALQNPDAILQALNNHAYWKQFKGALHYTDPIFTPEYFSPAQLARQHAIAR